MLHRHTAPVSAAPAFEDQPTQGDFGTTFNLKQGRRCISTQSHRVGTHDGDGNASDCEGGLEGDVSRDYTGGATRRDTQLQPTEVHDVIEGCGQGRRARRWSRCGAWSHCWLVGIVAVTRFVFLGCIAAEGEGSSRTGRAVLPRAQEPVAVFPVRAHHAVRGGRGAVGRGAGIPARAE